MIRKSRSKHPKSSFTRTGMSGSGHAWRCTGCGKLLGVRQGSRIQLRTARGENYLVSLPVTACCSRCGALNTEVRPS